LEIYDSIRTGTQIWLDQNLKTTKYNDGTSIPEVTGGTNWDALTTPAFCWYGNDESTYHTVLYNWFTVNTGKLCPDGWHVPTDADWTTLITFHGGASIAGTKMREVGTAHWISPNTGATNEYGFTALPGGFRDIDENFKNIYHHSYWWSSTEVSATNAYRQTIANYLDEIANMSDSKKMGFSIR